MKYYSITIKKLQYYKIRYFENITFININEGNDYKLKLIKYR